MEEEIWREVEECAGYYVSNKNTLRNPKNEIIKGWIQRGYRYVAFSNGVKHPFNLIVAKAFPEICGEWFDGAVVHHKDFNKLNNVPENLIVLTQSEHAALHYDTQPVTFKKCTEKRAKSISKALKGKVNRHLFKPILQYTLDGIFIQRWESMSSIKVINKKTGKKTSIGSICSCCKGRVKQAGGYIWRYEKEVDD